MAPLKLAASNIAWTPDDDRAIFQKMTQWGFSGLEIAPTRLFAENPYDHQEESAEIARTIEDQFGLAICSIQSIWRGRTENLFDPEGAIILADVTEKALSYADALNCPNLVFGCPGNRAIPAGKHDADALPFFESIGAASSRHRATIALEPNPPIYHTNFMNTTREAYEFLKSIPEPHQFAINLDFGAIISNGENVADLEFLIPYVSHVHISEPHLAPIETRTEHHELRALLQDCNYKGYISLEMATTDYENVCNCLAYMAEVFL